jgi:hypothetical protein
MKQCGIWKAIRQFDRRMTRYFENNADAAEFVRNFTDLDASH